MKQKNILDTKFSEHAFKKFVDDLLPDFVEEKHPIITKSSTSNRILQNLWSLGTSEQCRLTVITARMSESNSAKRLAITQEMFEILKQHRIRNTLVAFYTENKTWRLSLLTTSLKIKNNKVTSETSDPRRFSYQLGPGTKTQTPRKFLVERGKVKDLDDLKERFSIEVVNKQFYNAITTQFMKLMGAEYNDGQTKKAYQPELILPEMNSDLMAEFAVRLIGRIIFCWFLKEKRSASGLNLMPENLVSSSAARRHPDYYHNVLEPIFFGCLNTKVEQRDASLQKAPFSQIPYLNGGLFNPHESDFYNTTKKVTIRDDWFVELFEILEQYNFTVDEDTEVDVDLSIDPEMLGRIFENLLAEINPETGESARKTTGSFYTPREVVTYMVNQALRNFLEQATSVASGKITNLMTYEKLQDIKLTKKESEEIVQALMRLKVIDPACGSGVFPISILQKMFYILQRLDYDKKDNYTRKLEIIQRNIYGVDIQPIAIEIAKLRCFLTLVIDEEIDDTRPNRGIQPLPNLDFKFVTADTLRFLPENPNDPFNMFEPKSSVSLVQKIRDDYFLADKSGRAFLKAEFGEAQSELSESQTDLAKARYQHLAQWEPFKNRQTDWFDSEWMFGVKNFDIVIGNPPYGAAMTPKMQKYCLKHYKVAKSRDDLKGSLDTFALFMERGLGMLKTGGNLAFIVPMAITSNDTMTALQNELESKCEILRIASFENRPRQIFDNACVRTSIVFCEKTNTPTKCLYMTRPMRRKSEMTIKDVLDKLTFVEAFKYKMYGRYPKIGNVCELEILDKLAQTQRHVCDYANEPISKILEPDERSVEGFYYRAAGGRYFNIVTLEATGTSAERWYRTNHAELIAACLSTSLFWFYQQVYTDGLNLKGYEIDMFPLPDFEKIDDGILQHVKSSYLHYLDEIEIHTNTKNVTKKSKYNVRQFKEYKIAKSKTLVDKLDDLIDPLYGLTASEVRYIKEYEEKIRIGNTEKWYTG